MSETGPGCHKQLQKKMEWEINWKKCMKKNILNEYMPHGSAVVRAVVWVIWVDYYRGVILFN